MKGGDPNALSSLPSWSSFILAWSPALFPPSPAWWSVARGYQAVKCLDPYITSKGEAYGCSRCLPCLVKRRRIWTHRLMLEASLWESNAYVTLSYAEEELPKASSGAPTLKPPDVQLFMKRLRKHAGVPIRFYLVGEYGDKSWRPHYHLALFNFPTCLRSRTMRRPYKTRPEWRDCCPQCRLVGDVWGKGDVDLGNLEPSSAQYVAGYVTKKMTSPRDIRLDGRYPEFARMSLRPGIGYGILDRLTVALSAHGLNGMMVDVPSTLRHGKKEMPLGRYLRRKLRLKLGRNERCPDEVLASLQEEMHPLLQAAKEVTWHPTVARFRKEVLRNLIIDENMGLQWKIEGQETRQKKRIMI